MKLNISTLLIFSLLASAAFCDHDRSPVKFKHSSHELSDETKALSQYINFQKNKFINFDGQVYCLSYHTSQYTGDPYHLIIFRDLYLYSYDTKDNNYSEILHQSYDEEPGIMPSGDHAAFFGYAGYLWYFAENNGVWISRFNPQTKVLDQFEYPYPQGNDSYNYSAACVMDSTIYVFKYGNSSIIADIYGFDEASQELEYLKSETIQSGISEYKAVASAEAFMDKDNILKIAFTTYDYHDNKGEAWFYNPETQNSGMFFSKSDLADIKLAFGSMQAEGESQAWDEGQATASNPNRMSVFFVKDDKEKHKNKVYNKRCPIGFVQFVYGNESFQRLTDDECRVVLPSDDYYAKGEDNAKIFVTYNYVAVDKTLAIPGNDGCQKQILLVNADKKMESNFSYFNSDIYMNDPYDNRPSTNFIDESFEGLDVRDFWTLVGITDGAPPAPIDWEVWEENYSNNLEPTELELVSESESLVTMEISAENSYTQATKIEAEMEAHIVPKLELTGGYSSKFTQANENVNEFSQKLSYSITQSLGLNEASQETAQYFYLVPEITRYNYKLYPWWNDAGNLPVSGVDDYMFKTTKHQLKVEPVEISEFPHSISEPNDPDMMDWLLRGDSNEEGSVANYAKNYGVFPASVGWTNNSAGQIAELVKEDISMQEQKYSYSTEVEYSAGFKFPKIFEFEKEWGNELEYSMSSSVESSLKKTVKVDYHNMVEASKGIMCEELSVDAYLFTPNNQVDWWYYEGLPNGFKPWYIAYGVSMVSKDKAVLLSPSVQQQFYKNQHFDFSWETSSQNSALFIASSPNIRPENIVFKGNYARNLKESSPELLPGVYYWCVAAVDGDGQLCWSEVRSFEIVDQNYFKDFMDSKSGFSMKIFPNPVSVEEVSVSFEVLQEGPVEIFIQDMLGRVVYTESLGVMQEGMFRKTIPVIDLNGMGIVSVRTTTATSSAKIIRRK